MSPYGIKDETPEMTKKMEQCVLGVTGTNKRTGKPYTKGDKIAICKSMMMKKIEKSEEANDFIYDELAKAGVKSVGILVDMNASFAYINEGGRIWRASYSSDFSFDWKNRTDPRRISGGYRQ
jgi:hypothetical protein